jgi:hypothetical protein
MQVGVIEERLGPGVEEGEQADPSAQVAAVGGGFEESLGDGVEEPVVERPGLAPEEGAELLGDGEDQVEVRHRQELGHARLDPACRGQGLALGAVAVTARVVDRMLVAALRAAVEVATQGRRPAGLDRCEDPAVLPAERLPVHVEETLAEPANDVGHLEPGRGGHRSASLSRPP